MILITGGAGFIGTNFILDWLSNSNSEGIVNVDKLTYAANKTTLSELSSDHRHIFLKSDICDSEKILLALKKYSVRAVINLAAESHVDRSIRNPINFIENNIVGTFKLLEATREYWVTMPDSEKCLFRFLHISTDEVYGSLSPSDSAFLETNQYCPNSPYSASKAASNHLVRAWHQTYGVPVLTINCSNNYGPYQFPEKLIPLVILNALAGKAIPIYGDGKQIRDWVYVKDHCSAIRRILEVGKVGETYNVGGSNEMTNNEVVNCICSILDSLKPKTDGSKYSSQITYIADRPGHDRRYAINDSKLKSNLGWSPDEIFETGIKKTVQWYLDNHQWIKGTLNDSYVEWVNHQYG